MNNVYTVREVCARTNLSYKQLDDIARKAILAPSIAIADGRGSRRLYSDRDVVLLRAVAILRKMGIGRGTFTAILKALQSPAAVNGERSRKYIVVSGSKVSVADDNGLKQLLRDPLNVTIFLPLAILTTENK